MTPTYYTEIGQHLRAAREELRLTLQEASAALHIRAHYLYALEEGELEKLPGAAYTKGYLQVYASYLYLDKGEILRRFERVKDSVPEKGFFLPMVFGKEKKPSNLIAWSGLLLVLAIYIIWFMAFRPVQPEFPVISPPPEKTEIYDEFSVNSVLNLPCAIRQVSLYPPCYSADAGSMEADTPLPLRRQIISVMELAR
jgi:cytoskeletal protein RodZ